MCQSAITISFPGLAPSAELARLPSGSHFRLHDSLVLPLPSLVLVYECLSLSTFNQPIFNFHLYKWSLKDQRA